MFDHHIKSRSKVLEIFSLLLRQERNFYILYPTTILEQREQWLLDNISRHILTSII